MRDGLRQGRPLLRFGWVKRGSQQLSCKRWYDGLAMPIASSAKRICPGQFPLAALLASALLGPGFVRAEGQAPGSGGNERPPARSLESPEGPVRNDIALSPAAPLAIPWVASSRDLQGNGLFTEFRIANLSDTATTVTLRFRDSSGADLALPFPSNPAAPSVSPVDSLATVELSLAAHETVSRLVVQRSPSRSGWAEVTAMPDVPISASAMLGEVLPNDGRDFYEVPAARAYSQAWLLADHTGGFGTELHLVNLSSTDEQELKLRFRAADADCETTLEVGARGREQVTLASALPCSASKLGSVEIQGSDMFAGIGTVRQAQRNETFVRTLAGIERLLETPTALSTWTVSAGRVQFGFLSSQACIDMALRTLVGVTYTVHSSAWQRRADADAEWAFVPGTNRNGQICAYAPEAPGEYRGVAEITVGGMRGTHASANILTHAAAVEIAPPVVPSPSPGSGAGQAVESQFAGWFVPLPAGEFVMGSQSAQAAADEAPLTTVRISAGVEIGRHEVTLDQWVNLMGPNVYDNDECGSSCPVSQVTWNDVQRFLTVLNRRDTRFTYRLPTEAEWEYAARAGTSGDRYGDLEAIAWYDGNSGGNGDIPQVHPVGQKQANAWGLHDMLGNVSEWVNDWYAEYPGGSVADPQGPASGAQRVYRGGSYLRSGEEARASSRRYTSPGFRVHRIGFRLARTAR